ncbi:MAG: RNase adapter RapZ [Pseudomonadota bacterium]|nr:RNase adapter RapZ [Pseudomonadota bacterium]
MELVVVSGLSGSGKTVALHTLEDEEFHCIDNLHPGLLKAFVSQFRSQEPHLYDKAGIGIDARAGTGELRQFPVLLNKIRESGVDIEVIFLQADTEALLKRFSETRRKHPLTRQGLPLVDAINLERSLLAEVAQNADLVIDTTKTNLHQLRAIIRDRVGQRGSTRMSLLFQSFGYKHGVPSDSDFVFDVRCLPNPYWEPALRALTGQDPEVRDFLENSTTVEEMFESLNVFLDTWVPRFAAENRRYLSVSVGCTGGQHRSVYLVERLTERYKSNDTLMVISRHRELGNL